MVTGTIRAVGRQIMQQGGCPYNSHINSFRPSYAISQRDDRTIQAGLCRAIFQALYVS